MRSSSVSFASDQTDGLAANDARPRARRRGDERSSSSARPVRSVRCVSRSERPTSSSMRASAKRRQHFAHTFGQQREVVRPPSPGCRRTSCAALLSGWRYPVGQLFRWHCRAMSQPIAIRTEVPNPYSSAPSIAAITTSSGVLMPPSVRSRTRERRPFITSVCCVSARPSSHGQPAYLIDVERRGAGAAGVAADQDVIGSRLGNSCGNRADPGLCHQLDPDLAPAD